MKKTLLYVEDNEDHAHILELTLRKLDLSINLKWVKTGEEALEYLKARSINKNSMGELPDLIIIDLKLTKMNGFGLIKKIKIDENLKLIPVVVLTSSEDPLDINTAYRNYANSYIAKSIETSMYRKQIESVINYWMEQLEKM